jgi:hypothetical protein
LVFNHATDFVFRRTRLLAAALRLFRSGLSTSFRGNHFDFIDDYCHLKLLVVE